MEYRLGRGLHLGKTGLTLGGFSTFEAEVDNDGEYVLEFDTNLLALLQPLPYFRALAEIELG
ncbi:MAG: hypothetical protein O7G30_18675, partial [Proteobacteria bacterium]|nr:hypothetical protein [Pseudomonadota bacterium]